MSSPKAAVYLRGISASPGLARGPLVRLEEGVRTGTRAPASGPDDPARLRSAIALACAELTTLMQRASDPDAEALLAFQVAMLQDPVVAEPAFTAIGARVPPEQAWLDRKSTRLNSSHLVISYAVFCLKKKSHTTLPRPRFAISGRTLCHLSP